MHKKNIQKISVLVLAQVLSAHVFAADLLDVWKSAQTKDPAYIASRFDQLAGERRREQAESMFRPNVFLSATAGYMTSNSSTTGAYFYATNPAMGPASGAVFNTSVNGGTLTRHTLGAVQPLYNQERAAQKSQLRTSSDLSDLSWQLAQQNLILLVAERYFDVLKAEELLRLAKKQEVAIGQMYAEIKKRQQLGDAAQTDLQEAAQKLEATKVGIVNAQMDLKVKQLALGDLMADSQNLKQLSSQAGLDSLSLVSLEQVIAKMRNQNLGLRMAALSQEITRSEIAKHEAIASPKVDLVAQTSRERLSGSGDYGSSASNTATNHMVGVQLTMPLYTGGYRQAKYEESLQNHEKAKAEYDRITLEVERSLRQVWLALNTSKDRIRALADAKTVSQARLVATRNGHRVGSRSTLELLGAEVDAINSEQALFVEQTQYLLNRLRLSALTSDLGEADLKIVNAYLK